jgi:hypothetical protein
LLKVKSIHCFCAELSQILAGKVSVLYDFLGREDVNWRGLSGELAHKVSRSIDLGSPSQRAFVVDDTSKARPGRKVEGTSSYYDHTEGRTRHGHQVLQLGLAGEKGFLPIEAQIVMGEKSAVDKPQDKPFKDQRSSAARDMRPNTNSSATCSSEPCGRACGPGMSSPTLGLGARRTSPAVWTINSSASSK